MPALRLHAADVADHPHQVAGFFDLHRLAHRTHGGRGLRDAGIADGAAQRGPVHHLPQRAADILAHLRGHAAGLARRLEHRETDARRRAGAERRVGAGGERDADAGEAEHELVCRLARRHARAFTDGIADIAKDKQIAERGAGEADEILRLTDDETLRKTAGGALGGGGRRIRILDPRDQRRVDRHLAVAREVEKALGEVGVVGLERGLDLAAGDVGVERAFERWSARRTGSSCAISSVSASMPRGTIVSAAITQAKAAPSGNAIRGPYI